MAADAPDSRPILVTGATGYIGGRLVPRLLEAGYAVRCMARSPRKLQQRTWSEDPGVTIVRGDAAKPDELEEAMRGCRAAYYLIHSMLAAGDEYSERDRRLASQFASAAESVGLERIVYLGGLGETGEGLSEHLSSRREVEKALASGSVPVTVLRAAMIIGAGSASFEILRYLVERLPIMITPKWVSTECQPIAVDNVLHYLVACLEDERTLGEALDIGGTDVVTYSELMQTMASALDLRRRIILPVPVLTPKLSSLWIHFVTPLSKEIARPLAEGLRNRVVAREDRATRWMPQTLLGAEESIRLAVEQVRGGTVETSWSDAGVIPGDPDWAGGTEFTDRHETTVGASAEDTFRAVCRIGGVHGWYAANALWGLRGLMDRMVGGPGLRRGRRHPETIGYGDALDFWRVTDIEHDRLLSLRAEMKVPGDAVLQFEIDPIGEERCRLSQTARFLPRGLLGLLYWYAVLPLHGVVFRGMLKGIRRAAEADGDDGVAAEVEAA